ncbi:Sen15 protein-domain-containing protein [Lipomyces kononenkoae]|uniref:Sen15 protein-domain-containing protein n=1 Tax=Lipomyces kononenkoae TaxID=34357 RepID=A0ACC3SXZ7_LIPKO
MESRFTQTPDTATECSSASEMSCSGPLRPTFDSDDFRDKAYNAANPRNNLANSDIACRVKRNLDLHHLWMDLSIHRVNLVTKESIPFLDDGQIVLVLGRPPDKLYSTDSYDEDDSPKQEWVLPVRTESKWSAKRWVSVFESLADYHGKAPERILMAMYTDDSTVVYYFIHWGLIKPRKN